jgi:transcriptional regulator with XRE-family HTH domain
MHKAEPGSRPALFPRSPGESGLGGFSEMFDTRHALADMADQIRTFRTAEGLTLQQLASRSGVAASTIHKVEAQQMVPTVCVLLKIAKGLGCRPERLVRDRFDDDQTEHGLAAASLSTAQTTPSSSVPSLAAGTECPAGGRVKPDVGVWQLDLSANSTPTGVARSKF